MDVKHTSQAYVTTELKIKMFCFFVLSTIALIFIGMENSISIVLKFAIISSEAKRAEMTQWNPQPAINILNQLLPNHVHNKTGFWKPVINGRDFI